MKTRKIVTLFMALLILFTSTSCSNTVTQQESIKPDISRMKSICELATMDCYYHNVAKYKEEDAEGVWIWKKDKHFWIEYSGIVTVGIDASLLVIEVKEDAVKIAIPEAKVLREKVNALSLTEESFIVDKNSAKITGEDQSMAFKEAQKNMVLAASKDSALLASAQQRAQILIEEYVSNIGKAVGKEYSVEWVYLDKEANSIIDTTEEIKTP